MGKFLNVVVLLLLPMFIFTQIKIKPHLVKYSSEDSVIFQSIDINIVNEGNTDQKVWWKVKIGSDFPKQWDLFFYDNNITYVANFLTCPMGKPNTINANDSSIFVLNVLPNEKIGFGNVWLELYGDKEFTILLDSTSKEGFINIGKTTSLKETDYTKDISILPNPSESFFYIKGELESSKVVLFSSLGMRIPSQCIKGKTIDLSGYSDGLYFLYLYDEAGNILLTKKLMKIAG